MNHGNGLEGREDRSSGIEILIAEAFAKSSPTEPLRLVEQAARRNRNYSDSSGNSLADASR